MSNIKINDVPQRIQYAATNGQTQFSIPFPFFQNSDVIVWQDGVQIFPGAAPGEYLISGAGSPSGGLITLVTPAALDSIITIEGDMPIDRTSIYSATISNLTGSDLNGDFNREVVMMQQINTTQKFLQLQYAPWALVSQDLTETKDRYIPLLPAGYGWRMNALGTAIEAIAIPEGGFAPQIGSFVTVDDERAELPNSFPLSDLGNASTSGMGIPAGTTAQRVTPVAPNIGLRYNTDLGIIEAYIGATWVEIPSSSAGLFLPLSGGTMGGNILMDGNFIKDLPSPADPNDAATKNYVDSAVGTGAGGANGNIQYNDGGVFEGDPNFNTNGAGGITVNGSVQVDNILIDGNKISPIAGVFQIESGQLFNDFDANNFKIVSLATPTNGGDAVNKTYADSIALGFHFVTPVTVASTANLASTYNNGVSGVGATLTASVNGAASIDGVSLALTNRVLFKDQSNTFENGIYTVTQVGTAGTPAIYTRATDYDTPTEIDPGDMVPVLQGTVNASTFWVQTATVVTVGTSPISFTQFGTSAANTVTITGTQTISGVKTFTAVTTLNNFVFDTNQMQHLGDLDNYFEFGTDAQNFVTGGSSRADISNSGLRLGGANSRVTTILNENNMASNSPTALATQASIKAYADSIAGGGIAASKAWISFNTITTSTIRASHNVTSLSDNGAGDTTINFTIPFSTANYGFSGAAGHGAGAGTTGLLMAPYAANPTASAFRLITTNSAGTPTDFEFVGATFFGTQ